jgi:hypothetical protein
MPRTKRLKRKIRRGNLALENAEGLHSDKKLIFGGLRLALPGSQLRTSSDYPVGSTTTINNTSSTLIKHPAMVGGPSQVEHADSNRTVESSWARWPQMDGKVEENNENQNSKQKLPKMTRRNMAQQRSTAISNNKNTSRYILAVKQGRSFSKSDPPEGSPNKNVKAKSRSPSKRMFGSNNSYQIPLQHDRRREGQIHDVGLKSVTRRNQSESSPRKLTEYEFYQQRSAHGGRLGIEERIDVFEPHMMSQHKHAEDLESIRFRRISSGDLEDDTTTRTSTLLTSQSLVAPSPSIITQSTTQSIEFNAPKKSQEDIWLDEATKAIRIAKMEPVHDVLSSLKSEKMAIVVEQPIEPQTFLQETSDDANLNAKKGEKLSSDVDMETTDPVKMKSQVNRIFQSTKNSNFWTVEPQQGNSALPKVDKSQQKHLMNERFVVEDVPATWTTLEPPYEPSKSFEKERSESTSATMPPPQRMSEAEEIARLLAILDPMTQAQETKTTQIQWKSSNWWSKTPPRHCSPSRIQHSVHPIPTRERDFGSEPSVSSDGEFNEKLKREAFAAFDVDDEEVMIEKPYNGNALSKSESKVQILEISTSVKPQSHAMVKPQSHPVPSKHTKITHGRNYGSSNACRDDMENQRSPTQPCGTDNKVPRLPMTLSQTTNAPQGYDQRIPKLIENDNKVPELPISSSKTTKEPQGYDLNIPHFMEHDNKVPELPMTSSRTTNEPQRCDGSIPKLIDNDNKVTRLPMTSSQKTNEPQGCDGSIPKLIDNDNKVTRLPMTSSQKTNEPQGCDRSIPKLLDNDNKVTRLPMTSSRTTNEPQRYDGSIPKLIDNDNKVTRLPMTSPQKTNEPQRYDRSIPELIENDNEVPRLPMTLSQTTNQPQGYNLASRQLLAHYGDAFLQKGDNGSSIRQQRTNSIANSPVTSTFDANNCSNNNPFRFIDRHNNDDNNVQALRETETISKSPCIHRPKGYSSNEHYIRQLQHQHSPNFIENDMARIPAQQRGIKSVQEEQTTAESQQVTSDRCVSTLRQKSQGLDAKNLSSDLAGRRTLSPIRDTLNESNRQHNLSNDRIFLEDTKQHNLSNDRIFLEDTKQHNLSNDRIFLEDTKKTQLVMETTEKNKESVQSAQMIARDMYDRQSAMEGTKRDLHSSWTDYITDEKMCIQSTKNVQSKSLEKLGYASAPIRNYWREYSNVRTGGSFDSISLKIEGGDENSICATATQNTCWSEKTKNGAGHVERSGDQRENKGTPSTSFDQQPRTYEKRKDTVKLQTNVVLNNTRYQSYVPSTFLDLTPKATRLPLKLESTSETLYPSRTFSQPSQTQQYENASLNGCKGFTSIEKVENCVHEDINSPETEFLNFSTAAQMATKEFNSRVRQAISQPYENSSDNLETRMTSRLAINSKNRALAMDDIAEKHENKITPISRYKQYANEAASKPVPKQQEILESGQKFRDESGIPLSKSNDRGRYNSHKLSSHDQQDTNDMYDAFKTKNNLQIAEANKPFIFQKCSSSFDSDNAIADDIVEVFSTTSSEEMRALGSPAMNASESLPNSTVLEQSYIPILPPWLPTNNDQFSETVENIESFEANSIGNEQDESEGVVGKTSRPRPGSHWKDSNTSVYQKDLPSPLRDRLVHAMSPMLSGDTVDEDSLSEWSSRYDQSKADGSEAAHEQCCSIRSCFDFSTFEEYLRAVCRYQKR